jgi:tRNA-specific 2-thiouridylase
VGKVGIKDFLSQYVDTVPGAIINQHDKIIGEHDGAIFYTIGQRQGLHVGGGLPYYVVAKNMKANEVYVSTDLQDQRLWSKQLTLGSMHWIDKPKKSAEHLNMRTRYRARLVKIASLRENNDTSWQFTLDDEVRAVTPGQSAVIYDGEQVLGGGIVI